MKEKDEIVTDIETSDETLVCYQETKEGNISFKYKGKTYECDYGYTKGDDKFGGFWDDVTIDMPKKFDEDEWDEIVDILKDEVRR